VDLISEAQAAAEMQGEGDAPGPVVSPGHLADAAFQPLFTPAPRTGVPSAWYGHVPFAYWIVRSLRPAVIVELGTHNGVSYAAFCDAVARETLQTQCFAVDSWRGDEHAGFYGEEVYRDLAAFHDGRFAAFSTLIRSSFDEARDYFPDGSIDLLHIDGCHAYEAVRRDFETWLPKLSPRAVVLLHDTNVRERQFGVWRLWAELREAHPGFEFLHEHGLGVLALGPAVPQAVIDLCTGLSADEIAQLRARFAFSGRCCGLEAEVTRLQAEALAGAEFRAASDRLTAQLNEAMAHAQGLAEARDDAAGQAQALQAALRTLQDDLPRRLAEAAGEARAAAAEEAARAAAAAAEKLAGLSAAIADRDTKLAEAAARNADVAARLEEAQGEAGRVLEVGRVLEKLVLSAHAADAEPHLARLRAERDRLAQTEAAQRLQAEDRAAQIAQLDAHVALLRQHLQAYEQSTAWRMTWPLRAAAARVPRRARRLARLTLKSAWWVLTPLRLRARLRDRRGRAGGPAAPDPASLAPALPAAAPPASAPPALVPSAGPVRFSLDRLPPLRGSFGPTLDWYDPVTPLVSVIVLNWNRSDLTLLCLQHLWQRTTGHAYEIIVVDNGSSQADLDQLRAGGWLARIIPLGTNRYFGEANNIGVEAARGRLVCLLNNDAFVHPGWLEPLVAMLEANPDIGAAGPRFLYPGGRLQEAGALVNPDGSVIQLGKGEDAGNPLYAAPRQVDYISAACVLLRRREFLAVLGFDLTWDPAYYEDVDLCLKLRLAGLRTVYTPASVVTHIENATSADASHGLQLDSVVALNRSKFVARWGAYLDAPDAAPPLLLPAPCAPPPAALPGRPRVLIFTPYNITPGGGERYFLSIAEALRGHAEVVLVTPGRFSRLRILTMGRDFGLRLDHVATLPVSDLAGAAAFDLAFVVGNEIFPPVGRLARRNIFICQFPFPIGSPDYARQARPFWNDYDLLLTYSAFVRKHLLDRAAFLSLPRRPVEVLAPPVQLLPLSLEKKPMILHVGRFFTGGHCKRQDRLIEAFGRLIAQGVSAELHLAGSIHPEGEHRAYYDGLVRSAAGLPVFFHVNCSAGKLRQLYADSLIYWHATGFGHDVDLEPHRAEHFGISVVEAMSAGCIPIVLAAGGPAEIVTDGVNGFHFQTLPQLCELTRWLMQDSSPAALATLARAANGAAGAHDEAGFRAQLGRVVGRFVPELLG
jgi:GT2 family glycosyltransferase/glycosyltransferase involved in cell wall biosynthesis